MVGLKSGSSAKLIFGSVDPRISPCSVLESYRLSFTRLAALLEEGAPCAGIYRKAFGEFASGALDGEGQHDAARLENPLAGKGGGIN